MTLEPHQQRVLDEKTELDEKINKLVAFMETRVFDGLCQDEQDRMNRQCEAMLDYSRVLGERITAFDHKC